MGNTGRIIIGIIAGAILLIIGFNLWPVLNGSTNQLHAYYRDGCNVNGTRIAQLYKDSTVSVLPSPLDANTYYSALGVHGGRGQRLADSGGQCTLTAGQGVLVGATSSATAVTLYDEYGNTVSAISGASATTITGITGGGWYKPNSLVMRFSGIINLLIEILPVVSIAGFVGIGAMQIYKGTGSSGSIGRGIVEAIGVLIGIVVLIEISPAVMDGLITAGQPVVSGQYIVNSGFGNIILLLFGIFPVVYIAGFLVIVAMYGRSMFLGMKSG